jgi:hypothetical protein
MKVRKFLFAGALIVASLFSVNSVMAQTTGDVTVNLKFQPIQSIVVTSGAEGVNLVYANKTDYSEGKFKIVNDHLEIFSTGGFLVTVKAESDFTNNSTGAVAIPASDVKVTATTGTDNDNNYGTGGLPEVVLSNTEEKNFIASDTGGTGLKFNVKYDNYGGHGNAYINKYIFEDGAESVYSTKVTYTIAAN